MIFTFLIKKSAIRGNLVNYFLLQNTEMGFRQVMIKKYCLTCHKKNPFFNGNSWFWSARSVVTAFLNSHLFKWTSVGIKNSPQKNVFQILEKLRRRLGMRQVSKSFRVLKESSVGPMIARGADKPPWHLVGPHPAQSSNFVELS